MLPFAATETLTESKSGDPRFSNSGSYSFSDELGGFRIVSVTGTGTRSDPIVVTQELESSSPITIVIRATGPIDPFSTSANPCNGFLYLRAVVLNNSGQAWIEFELELQEVLRKASVFGDGLSFDQRQSGNEVIGSDSFLEFSRDFEPYDRLLFRKGTGGSVEDGIIPFLITDFTPRAQFYLVLDPRIPST